jgi:hypothetical protein
VLAAPEAVAQEATREGGRLGAGLVGGLGSVSGGRADASLPLVGLTLRFGGAFTDRFHLLGEFTLAAMPGGDLSSLGSVTAFHAALGLAGQGYLGPRFFLRGGVGAGWATATNGNTWFLPLPGPRFSWALGYDLWRRGEQSFSLSLEGSYTMLFNGASVFDRLLTLGLGVGFDWY